MRYWIKRLLCDGAGRSNIVYAVLPDLLGLIFAAIKRCSSPQLITDAMEMLMVNLPRGARLPAGTTAHLPPRRLLLASTAHLPHHVPRQMATQSARSESPEPSDQDPSEEESTAGSLYSRPQEQLGGVASAENGNGKAPVYPSGLWEIELLRGDKLDRLTIDRWREAYRQMAQDARDIGIPASAIPSLPDNPSKEDLKSARDRLNGIIQSFLSSGL